MNLIILGLKYNWHIGNDYRVMTTMEVQNGERKIHI